MEFDIFVVTCGVTNQKGAVDKVTKYGISCSALSIRNSASGGNWSKGVVDGGMRLSEPVKYESLLGTSTKIDDNHIDESQLSTTVPTRLLLIMEGIELLKGDLSEIRQLFTISDWGILVEFWDLRQAVLAYEEARHIGGQVRFCCPSVLPSHLIETHHSAILVTVSSSFDCKQVMWSVGGRTDFTVSPLGFLGSKGQTKFFLEAYDTRSIEAVLSSLPSGMASESCCLFINDRELLFDDYVNDRMISIEMDSLMIVDHISHSSEGAPSFLVHSPTTPTSNLNPSSDPTPTLVTVPPTKQDYTLHLERIISSADRRTTCMIKNIPNKYTQAMLIDMINETHWGAYDFIYLRMDFKNRCNVGYAFVNFIDPLSIATFAQRVMGRKWPRFNSDKICQVTYARIQGKAALLEKFRHSKVMMEPASYRPKVYYTQTNLRGIEEPFPYHTS